MQFIYHEECGKEKITITENSFIHLFKAMRTKIGQEIVFSNLSDNFFYKYKILQINKKNAICELINPLYNEYKKRDFTLAWAIVDPKTIEKTLPYLNEIGVSKIAFIYTQFSQRNFKIDFDKLKRINIKSSEQCGRNSLIEFEVYKTLKDFLKENNEIGVVDFCTNRLTVLHEEIPKIWLIGCEGGFAQDEKKLLKGFLTVGFDSDNILKSETAAIAISSKILL